MGFWSLFLEKDIVDAKNWNLQVLQIPLLYGERWFEHQYTTFKWDSDPNVKWFWNGKRSTILRSMFRKILKNFF